MAKLKVGMSFLVYPVSMARMFQEELERRDDVELYTIGPFFDDWIPWKNGLVIPRMYVKTPTVPLSREVQGYHIPYEVYKTLMPDDLDLFLVVDAGWHFSTRPHAKKVVLVETDPHCLKNHYTVPASYSDVVFCMQTPYMIADDIWLPYAVDNNWFYPEELDMAFDACIIGLQYQQRTDLVNRLRSKGKMVFYDNGPVFNEYRTLYNSSRVALSWSSLRDTPVRVYEAMGMKRPLVANRTPDIMRLFKDGVHFLGFDNLDEAEQQVNYLLEHPMFASEMAQSGYDEVMAKHTWKHRIDEMLKVISEH